MYDKELVLEILKQIINSINIVLKRFSLIKNPDDFVKTEEGLEKLDSICMQLIAIGEGLMLEVIKKMIEDLEREEA